MSARAGQWSDEEIEDLLEGEAEGGGDTQLVKQLRAALRAKTKQANEFREELGKAKVVSRQATLADLLKARELDPKVAALMPAEIEATEEAVDKWLGEYGDVLGAKPRSQKEAIPDEQVAAIRQMDSVAGTTSPAVPNDTLRAIQQAETPEALIAMIHAAGGQG